MRSAPLAKQPDIALSVLMDNKDNCETANIADTNILCSSTAECFLPQNVYAGSGEISVVCERPPPFQMYIYGIKIDIFQFFVQSREFIVAGEACVDV